MVQKEPTGLISVMPQAWATVTPYLRSKASVMARGQAEPPMMTRFRVESLPPVDSRCCRRASHTVGTAAVTVMLSLSRRAWTEGPSSRGPGMTRAAPAIGAENAKDQPLAWKSGTTGIATSRAEKPR